MSTIQFNEKQRSQLHLVFESVMLALPAEERLPSRLDSLAAEFRREFAGQSHDGSTESQLQREVCAAVRAAVGGRKDDGDGEVGVSEERVLEQDGCGYSVDALLTGPGVAGGGRGVVVEVDGPSHFVSPDNRQNGSTLLKHRLLRGKGWVVVSVPYFEWNALESGAEAKQGYLQGLLAPHLRQARALQ